MAGFLSPASLTQRQDRHISCRRNFTQHPNDDLSDFTLRFTVPLIRSGPVIVIFDDIVRFFSPQLFARHWDGLLHQWFDHHVFPHSTSRILSRLLNELPNSHESILILLTEVNEHARIDLDVHFPFARRLASFNMQDLPTSWLYYCDCLLNIQHFQRLIVIVKVYIVELHICNTSQMHIIKQNCWPLMSCVMPHINVPVLWGRHSSLVHYRWVTADILNRS